MYSTSASGKSSTNKQTKEVSRARSLNLIPSNLLTTLKGGRRRRRREESLRTCTDRPFPMKMDMDRQILSRFQRPPGAVPSSMLGLEALTGDLESFGFEDYLNDPRDSETFRALDMHHGMEVRLGLSKGPVCPSFI
ncbi:hypothetical protein F0562_005253 [Nyssa sinensis]|uniref:Uncharacterized protein n=1 Tax=Nyssa sinensis TaxID=561372 RepID=A0A5J5AJS3_9ASTE|nr:hypothetical protein F0562_005253 [Nyssa sinensis]